MQFSVEELGKLKRKISVEVPLSDVRATYDQVFAQFSGQIRVDGFRPGKFPRHLAEKRFKTVMEQEATRTLVPKYFDEVMDEMKVRPATQPHFTNLEIDKKAPFKFVAEFEIIPSFDLPPLTDFKLEEKKPKVTKKGLDERVEQLRGTRAQNEDKGAQPAAEGDVVTVDYEGKIDGEVFPGNSAQDHQVELGAGRFLPGFEKPLIGAKAGESRSFDVLFPQDYDQRVAGQTARFDAVVKKVEQKVLPPLEGAFFSEFGVEDLAGFRDFVKAQLVQEQERDIMGGYQQQVADQIKKKCTFEIPETLVEQHLAEFEHRLGHDDPKLLEDEKEVAKRKKAEKKNVTENIRLNYVIDSWARREKIEVSKEEVQQRFYLQAYMMRQNPEQLMQSPYGEQMMFQVEQQLLTTKVLENISNQVLGKDDAGAEKKTKTSAPGQRKAKQAEQTDGAAQTGEATPPEPES